MYRDGQLLLDELITNRYPLDEINEGYRAMRDGENIRGVIVYSATHGLASMIDNALLEQLTTKVVSRQARTRARVGRARRRPSRAAGGPAGYREVDAAAGGRRGTRHRARVRRGNAELTPARLVGHFDPARVLSDGYSPDVFEDGPLIVAMREVRCPVEEINRIPEETLNVLITVMSEGELHVPRLGRIASAPGFRLVAAMNPFDAIGTARISSAVYDRVCRLSVTYQSATDEVAIVGARSAGRSPIPHGSPRSSSWCGARGRIPISVGSSMRGAIDGAAVVLAALASARQPPTHPSVGLDASLMALSGPGETARGRRPLDRGDHHRVVARGVRPAGRGWGRPGKTGAPTGAISSRS